MLTLSFAFQAIDNSFNKLLNNTIGDEKIRKFELNSRMFANQASALIDKFVCDGNNAGERWTMWLEDLESFFVANKVKATEGEERLNGLLLLGGNALRRILTTLESEAGPTAENGATPTAYDQAKFRLNNYFKPVKNAIVEEYHFVSTCQKADESVAMYVTRLRTLATYCDFDSVDKRIVGQVVHKCNSTAFRRMLLKEVGLKLPKLLELGRVFDKLDNNLSTIEGKTAVSTSAEASIDYVSKKQSKGFQKTKPMPAKPVKASTDKKCFNCGGAWPHPDGRKGCPAANQNCRSCEKRGHFSKMCKGANKEHDMVDKIDEIARIPIEHRAEVFTIDQQPDDDTPKVQVAMCGVQLKFKIDTGATLNILDEEGYNALKPRPKLAKVTQLAFGFSSSKPLTMLGKFTTAITCNAMTVDAEFNVIKGNHGRLLSFRTSLDVNVVQVADAVNILPAKATKKPEQVNPEMARWIKEFPTVFTDKIGQMKNFELQLHIDKSVKPVQARPRNKPFHLIKLIDEQIAKKLAAGVIEEVVDEPTEWLSETVVIPKGEERDEAGAPLEIRLCTDMREPNLAIISEKHEMPNLESLVYAANRMKLAAKLDLNSAFEQIKLKEDCRYISRFRTHNAIYQHTTLFFGVKSAPEIFHNLIRKILIGIEGVVNATDDILIMGATDQQLEQRFRAVLTALAKHGFTCKLKKCVYGVLKITFFGLELSAKGVSLSEQKTAALKNFKAPANKYELHSFLALANYASRWIPKFGELAAPLWDLTHADAEWNWDEIKQKLVDTIKDGMIKSVGYFDTTWLTTLTADASPVGLSGVLTQENPKDMSDVKVITHVSRKLTDTETRYSQIEKEALA